MVTSTIAAPARALWRRGGAQLRLYIGSTGSLMIGSGAQLLTFAILARSLGVAQFGTYTVMVAVTNLAVQVCGLGATETMVRRVAIDPGIYRDALGHNLLLVAATGVPLVAGLTVAMPLFVHLGPDPLLNAAALGVFLVTNIVLVRIILLAEEIFVGHSRIAAANGVNLFYAFGRTATVAVACLVFHVDALETFVFWLFAGHLVVAAGCALAIRHLGRPRFTLLPGEVRLGFYFCTPLVFQALRQSADLLVLHVVAPPEVVGAFSMARRILDTSALTAAALYRMTYPRLARAAEAGLRAALPLILDVLKAGLAIAVVTATCTFAAASVMPWLFGRDFGRMVLFLHVMAWALIPITIRTVAAEALGASARHGARAALYNAGALVGAGAAAALTYAFGIDGTLAALFAVECGLATAFWTTLLSLVRGDPRGPSRSGPSPRPAE